MVVPTKLRPQVLANLHGGHQGRDSMMRRARQTVYWPCIDEEVAKTRLNCNICETHAPSPPAEPLIATPPPDYPFQQVVADLFQLEGYNYIAYADRLTGWLEVKHLGQGTTSHHLVSVLRTLFTRHGVPEEMSCDGGTNLVSEEMQNFLKKWRESLRVSSAYYPQSNGRAEAAVKSAKRVVRAPRIPRHRPSHTRPSPVPQHTTARLPHIACSDAVRTSAEGQCTHPQATSPHQQGMGQLPSASRKTHHP